MKLVLLSNLVAFTHSANKRWFSTPFRYVEGAHSNDLRFVENGLFGKSFRVREVNHDDITMLDKCNRLNLPENYTNDFYEAQLNRWPKLSIIVEAENDVVGYGLGRIESINTYEDPSGLIEQPYGASISRPFQGHILSLAVNEKYRGHQVAINMMHLLHHRFATEYGVDSAALFCRPSNKAAMQLYSSKLGYRIAKVIPQYYADSEDAFLMIAENLIKASQ